MQTLEEYLNKHRDQEQGPEAQEAVASVVQKGVETTESEGRVTGDEGRLTVDGSRLTVPDSQSTGNCEPSTVNRSEATVDIRVDNLIRICRSDLPHAVIDKLYRELTWDNPLYLKQARFGKINGTVEKRLSCCWERDGDLLITRGYIHELVRIFHAHRIKFTIHDYAELNPDVDYFFSEKPYGYQDDALAAVADRRFGIICGPLGCGKKVLILKWIAEKKLTALIVVKTKDQLYQWKNNINRFLGMEEPDLGLLGDKHKKIGKKITVAIDKTLYAWVGGLKDIIGFLVVDRCDAVNLKILFKIVLPINSYMMIGTANARRRQDGLTELMNAYLGPVLHEIKSTEYFNGLKVRPYIVSKETDFNYEYHDDYGELMTALCSDADRNKMIIEDILAETAANNHCALVTSARIEHLEILSKLLFSSLKTSEIITNRTLDSNKKRIEELFKSGKLQIILVTFKSIHTLDVKNVNRLFIASPVKYSDHVSQAVGNMLGAADPEDPPVIYDYYDHPGVLKASFNHRNKFYRKMGAK